MNEVLEDIATKVMKEKEGSLDGALKVHAMAADFSTGNEVGEVAMEVEENTVADQIEELGKDSEKDAEMEGEGRRLLVAPNGPADAKFVDAALIQEVVQSPTRASP